MCQLAKQRQMAHAIDHYWPALPRIPLRFVKATFLTRMHTLIVIQKFFINDVT